MTRVLLISPLPGIDPPCGDVTYTEGLLANPPAGVEYETYAEALVSGRLRELGRREDVRRSTGSARWAALARVMRERVINGLRKRGLLFREPFRHFEVKAGAYDLVHCHVFSASFPGLDIPLVVSNAAPLEDLYSGARGWSRWHVRVATWADRTLARLQHVQHTSYRMPDAAVVVAFTETLRTELLRRHAATATQLRTAPCFVDPAPPRGPVARPRRIGFVATDFEAKGGETVMRAFELVREVIPDAELVIVGSPPRLSDAAMAGSGITWQDRVPREALLGEYLATFDVLAYPTEFDGLPLTVLEAMAMGVPVVTSDFGAMPEIVDHGRAGRVVAERDFASLASTLIALLDPDENARVSSQTVDWFERAYSTRAAVDRLRLAYEAASEPSEQA